VGEAPILAPIHRLKVPLSSSRPISPPNSKERGRDDGGRVCIECLTLLTALWLTIGQPRSWGAPPVPDSPKSGKFLNFGFTTPQLKLAKNDN